MQIRDETATGANTATRVGTFLQNLIDSTVFTGEAETPPTAGDGLTGTNTFSVLPDGTSLTVSASGVRFSDIAGNSVLGRAAATSGLPVALTAGTDGHALRLSGVTLGFGTLATAAHADASITYAKFQDVAGLSLVGRSANTSGVTAAITATTTGQVPIYNGTSVGFGSPNFGALDVTTTGAILNNTTTPVLRLGLAPGSGAGSAASAGVIRLRNDVAGVGPKIMGRNAADSADIQVLQWGTTSSTQITVGDYSGGAVTIDMVAGSTIRLRGPAVEIGAAGGTTSTVYTPAIQWENTVTTPSISQLPKTAATATGEAMTTAAQGVSGNTSTTGGARTDRAGDATGAGGTHTGGAYTIRAGDATGGSGTRTGGALTIRPGSGATAGGLGKLTSGSASARYSFNDTGHAFFAATVAAQVADMGALTDSTGGTANGTLVDVGVVFSQANINDNFADLAAKVTAIRNCLRTVGLMA